MSCLTNVHGYEGIGVNLPENEQEGGAERQTLLYTFGNKREE